MTQCQPVRVPAFLASIHSSTINSNSLNYSIFKRTILFGAAPIAQLQSVVDYYKNLEAPMKVTRKTSWMCLAYLVLFTGMSCQVSGHKDQNSLSPSNDPKIAIDTSLWLKETRGIRDILEDDEGNIWFSSPDYVAKIDGKEVYYFSKNEGLTTTGNLHKDINGTIWVEDGFKLFRYNGTQFLEESFDNNSVSNNLWFQRGLSPADSLYAEPGIYELKADHHRLIPFPIAKADNNKYLYYPTTKAYMGTDGTIWFGTMEKVFGLKNNSFTSLGREEMGRENDSRNMGIRGIFVDSKGVLWIADNGAGVFKYDGNMVENFTKKHHLDEGDVKGSTLHRAFSIAEDTLGNMWFGTVYSGIWTYNPKTDEFKNYTKVDGVKSDNIWMIYKTQRGELLFAGETPSAVYRFNGETFDRAY